MAKKPTTMQELKRMRDICENEILISDSSHKKDIITISDASHTSKKEKKSLENRNLKNSLILKDSLDLTKEKDPIKSQNWLQYQNKVLIFYKKGSYSLKA